MTELKKTPDMIVFTPLTVTEKSGLSEVKNLYLKLLNEKYSMKK